MPSYALSIPNSGQTVGYYIWVKLEITGSRSFFVGGYYRHRKDDLEGLQELQKSVSKIIKHSENVWVLGTFNLPNLHWPDCEPSIKLKCSFKQVYNYFIGFLLYSKLTQVVTKPTQLNNTLDLFFTNTTLVNDVKCQSGLRDHDIVSAQACSHKRKPRKTYLFRKALLKENGTLLTETSAKANMSVFTKQLSLSPSCLVQMKVQDLVDDCSLPSESVPESNLNSIPVMLDIEITLNGLLKLRKT